MKNVDFALAGYSWPRMGSNHVIPFAALSTAMLAHRSWIVLTKLIPVIMMGREDLNLRLLGSNLLNYSPFPSFLTMR